jgi:nucleosome binding factor SPN SPT16 subunit
VFEDIKALKKAATQRIKEAETKATLIPQEKLQLDEKGGIIWKISDLSTRPPISRKKVTGTLIAVANGFRFTATDKSKVGTYAVVSDWV